MTANIPISALWRVAGWLVLLWGLLGVSTVCRATGFEVIAASTKLEGGVYRLNARIEYHFSNPALEDIPRALPAR